MQLIAEVDPTILPSNAHGNEEPCLMPRYAEKITVQMPEVLMPWEKVAARSRPLTPCAIFSRGNLRAFEPWFSPHTGASNMADNFEPSEIRL